MIYLKFLVVFLVLIIILFSGFMYSGVYNVAATKTESKPIKWLLNTTKENSVRFHSKGITVPNLDDESLFETGFHHFDQMCVSCHGAPGLSPSEIGEGLNPEPPDLAEVAAEMVAAEIFWVTQNGIKMTGMPAFGPTHSDQELWGIVAVIQKLPEMSAENYIQMKKHADTTSHEHDHGHHSHEKEDQESHNRETNNQTEEQDIHIHKGGEEHEH